jgi:hypothetical protein
MPYRIARKVLLVCACLPLAAGAAFASSNSANKGVPPLIFPVVGSVQYTDDFGAARAGGPHQGNDLMAEKKSPAVAVEAGTVKFWTTSANAGCMLYLYGASGTTYLYIHLNNDLTMKNDNRGKCVAGTAYAPGLKDGAHVVAGQLVGYVGDSGDANGIASHLHFEVHPNDGGAVDPFPYLRKAKHLLFDAKPSSTVSLALQAKLVSVGNGVLALQLSKLQVLPAKRAIDVNQKLTLSLAYDATVELPHDLPGFGGVVGLSVLKPGLAVTVYTVPTKATLAAKLGAASAFVASRVVIGG